MSAGIDNNSARVEREFESQFPLPRRLTVCVSAGDVHAFVYPLRNTQDHRVPRMMAYAIAPSIECRIDLNSGRDPELWVGRSAFDITAQEADEIAQHFGLRVQP